MKNYIKSMSILIGILFSMLFFLDTGYAQSTGCVAGRFGIDAGLYSGVIEYGTAIEPTSPRSNDWFQGAAGFGIISEANLAVIQALLQAPGNPTYEESMVGEKVSVNDGQIWIDGLFARDQFGGTGFQDPTSFITASKNGEDPAIWDPGQSNVLGKNDIIDVGGFMFRDPTGPTTSDLWFVGLFNMAEPGGTSYMDFEFYVDNVQYTPGSGFTSGGPQLGHTAYDFDIPGNITKIGDFIFSVALLGTGPAVEIRLWVSRADWLRLGGATMQSTPTFQWTGTYDGAFNNAPYGYAGIRELPGQSGLFCGYVNQGGETPLTPPWGSKGTKTNSYITNYIPYSIAEVGINLTAFGMDHSSLSGADPCFFPLNTFLVKTRASASFTAQLKDFAGPYSWGQPSVSAVVDATLISCDNVTVTVTAVPFRDDVTYSWETLDGNIIDGQGTGVITVDQPGTYKVTATLPTNCPVQSAEAVVGYDTNFPFFDGPPTFSYTVPCNVNDGTITVSASGATKPYNFFLYNNDNVLVQTSPQNNSGTYTFTGVEAGTYRVDVKGVYACIVTTGPFTIPDRIPVVISGNITHVDCFGDKTGAINLAVSGGNPPLTYLWSTDATSQNLLNMGAGSYTVYITDSDNCVTEETFVVTQPTQIAATIVKVDDPGNAGNGSATVNASGGTPGYTYLWTKTGDPAFVFTPSNDEIEVNNLSYGQYSMVVTDFNGCTRTFTVFIFEKEICGNGIDNDGDGLIDCDDPECVPAPPAGITPSDPLPCVDELVSYTAISPVGVAYDRFVWTVPANADVVDINGDPINIADVTGDILYVIWRSTAGGQICVRGVFEWSTTANCISPPFCINVDVDDVPPPATNIQID